jgi:hypothetical protein
MGSAWQISLRSEMQRVDRARRRGSPGTSVETRRGVARM